MITGKAIVITGANSGIGLEVLKLLLSKGNRILCVDRRIDRLKAYEDEGIHILQADVSSREAVDLIFQTAEEKLGFIDIFYANAGYAYYEQMDYVSWERMEAIFKTNVFSPIYSYQKYLKHIGSKKGVFAVTASAIGEMAMPGFTLYSSTKFAINGFQQAIRFETPDNLQFVCLYPISTDTDFFKTANEREFKKPFPVQRPETVAKKMVSGIESGKSRIYPSALFTVSKQLMKLLPAVRTVYWKMENKSFTEFKRRIKEEEK